MYEKLDVQGEGILTPEAFKSYLRINGYTASEAEIDAIIRRLDSNGDFLISFTEFISHFSPAKESIRFEGESNLKMSSNLRRSARRSPVREDLRERQLSVERSSPLRKSGA